MKKLEFVEAVANRLEVSNKAANAFVTAFIDVVTETIKNGEEVNITGFGKFTLVDREPRTCRNVSTGEKIEVPARKLPRFKTSVSYKKSFNS